MSILDEVVQQILDDLRRQGIDLENLPPEEFNRQLYLLLQAVGAEMMKRFLESRGRQARRTPEPDDPASAPTTD
ncbi:MAG: hypothetical protein GXO54_05080 [Chloroflexi bacterium]|nr:hypothetical protein [Chloroflexota bacterium]